ncbi:MAG: L-threonine aldolase [Chthonomonadales bacterium]|nr:L-threonine aldolase [Chthonomonadales bacterium]
MHTVIDLRSDTVTRPTPAMRVAMAEAEVGDDVYEDDPSVNALQKQAALLMGKEAGLFVPSGTMGNALALMTHTHPGDEVLMDSEAHSMLYELGLPATLAHVLTRQFRSRAGVPDVEEIAGYIHPSNLHAPGTSLIILENTHNRAGGTVIPLEVHKAVQALARANDLAVHLDGARLFNAAIATGIPAAEFASCTNSVTFCLSKGLGCPVGSVLCGTHTFIDRARRFRKMLGGGMRQAGILAAAGIYALENHIDRLAEDHRHARQLAAGLADVPGITLETREPPTNMVYFQTQVPAAQVAEALAAHDVLCGVTAPHRIRMVTHLDIDQEDINRTIAILHQI